jgi:hypothetical protein
MSHSNTTNPLAGRRIAKRPVATRYALTDAFRLRIFHSSFLAVIALAMFVSFSADLFGGPWHWRIASGRRDQTTKVDVRELLNSSGGMTASALKPSAESSVHGEHGGEK